MSASNLITFAAFMVRVKQIAFPEGMANNLDAVFRSRVNNCLIELQTHIKCIRDHKINYGLTQNMTNYCGVSQFFGPRGFVQGVYSFLPGESCRQLTHRSVSPDYIQCQVNASRCSEQALPYDVDNLPYINYPYNGDFFCADAESGRDLTYEAADHVFSIAPNSTWMVSPQLPCGYVLAIHWSGVNRKWSDSALVADDEDLIAAVAKYVRREAAIYDDGDLVLANAISQQYLEARGDLHYRCREEIRTRDTHKCMGGPDDITGFFQPLYPDNPYISPSVRVIELIGGSGDQEGTILIGSGDQEGIFPTGE